MLVRPGPFPSFQKGEIFAKTRLSHSIFVKRMQQSSYIKSVLYFHDYMYVGDRVCRVYSSFLILSVPFRMKVPR